MSKLKLEKKDRNIIIGAITVAGLASFFIDKAFDVAIIIMGIYFIHKYTRNLDISKEYSDYEFIDEERYHKGIKGFILFIEICMIIRLLTILFTKYDEFNGLEFSLIVVLLVVYESYLSKRYVKSIKNVKVNNSRPMVKNRVLVFILLIVFGSFTYIYFRDINKSTTENFMSVGEYEYKLSYNTNGKRIFELNTDNGLMRTEENDKNTKYFDNFMEDSKNLLNKKLIEDYSFKGMIFMAVFTLTQVSFKNKKIRLESYITGIFLLVFVIFGIISFNGYSNDFENDLFTYFHQYLSAY